MAGQTEHWKGKENVQRYARQTRIGSRIRYTPFAKKIVQSLGTLDEGATIVDLGIGPGLLAIELHKLWPQVKIVGVDPSNVSLHPTAGHRLDGKGWLCCDRRRGQGVAIHGARYQTIGQAKEVSACDHH